MSLSAIATPLTETASKIGRGFGGMRVSGSGMWNSYHARLNAYGHVLSAVCFQRVSPSVLLRPKVVLNAGMGWCPAIIALAHNLITGTPDITHRCAQHMNETRKREQQQDCQTQTDMQLEDKRCIGNVAKLAS